MPMGGLMWQVLADQWRQLLEQLPKLVDNVRAWLGSVDVFLGQWGASLRAPKPNEVQGLPSPLSPTRLPGRAAVPGFVVGLPAIAVMPAYPWVDRRARSRRPCCPRGPT